MSAAAPLSPPLSPPLAPPADATLRARYPLAADALALLTRLLDMTPADLAAYGAAWTPASCAHDALASTDVIALVERVLWKLTGEQSVDRLGLDAVNAAIRAHPTEARGSREHVQRLRAAAPYLRLTTAAWMKANAEHAAYCEAEWQRAADEWRTLMAERAWLASIQRTAARRVVQPVPLGWRTDGTSTATRPRPAFSDASATSTPPFVSDPTLVIPEEA